MDKHILSDFCISPTLKVRKNPNVNLKFEKITALKGSGK